MKYLLDTSVLLWSINGDYTKISQFIDIIKNENNYIAVSMVSYWEITIKKSLGKIKTPNNLIEIIEETGFSWLNLELRHISVLGHLPLHHHDPFDRLLIAQAQTEKFKLLTTNNTILQYGL
jgi:PIN domain nuclease of toxin-antitoxin system